MFTLTFDTDNAAFGEDREDHIGRAVEVSRILRDVAARVHSGEVEGPARDANGNRVGAFALTLAPPAAPEFTAEDFADLAPYGTPDTVERGGWTLSAVTIPDSDCGPPWEREDGHGPVSDWRPMGSHGHAPKRPGEWVLASERGGCSRFYDFAEACKIARRDGWGVEHPEGLTPREVAAMAAAADFERLRGWCADDWFYVGVQVTASRAGVKLGSAALWGIESDAGDDLATVAADLAREALAEAVKAAQAVQP